MLACRHKMKTAARLLVVGKGFNVNRRNMMGETALTLACAQGLATIAAVLIGRGADLTSRTSAGATALSLAEASGLGGVVKLLRSMKAPGARR
jgi:ankyrin repeat protein